MVTGSPGFLTRRDLLARRRPAGRGLGCPYRAGLGCHSPRLISTSRSATVSSVMMPSTPISSSSRIRPGELMVQACTCRPRAWARLTNAGVATWAGT